MDALDDDQFMDILRKEQEELAAAQATRREPKVCLGHYLEDNQMEWAVTWSDDKSNKAKPEWVTRRQLPGVYFDVALKYMSNLIKKDNTGECEEEFIEYEHELSHYKEKRTLQNSVTVSMKAGSRRSNSQK